jgi:hypothetical protein
MIQCLANNNDIIHVSLDSFESLVSACKTQHSLTLPNTLNGIGRRGSLAHSFAGTGIGRIGSAQLGSLY